MATNDKCCTIAPYFKIHAGKTADFRAAILAFLQKRQPQFDGR